MLCSIDENLGCRPKKVVRGSKRGTRERQKTEKEKTQMILDVELKKKINNKDSVNRCFLDPGIRIRNKFFPVLRIQGQKDSGSRIRIKEFKYF